MITSVLDYLKNNNKCEDKVLYIDKNDALSRADILDITARMGSFLAKRIPFGKPIVIMTGRTVFTPCCYLAAAQAGCFYAPMDPGMPKARLNQILNVINAEYMVVDHENYQLACSLNFTGEIFLMEEIRDTPVDEKSLHEVQQKLTLESPLYVIFTSGSSGVPKGVITSHGSLMNYIDAVCEVMKIDESDVLGNQAPLDYIAAIRDIYIPLKTSCSMVVIPKEQFAMPNQLFATLDQHRVTTLCWSVAGLEVPAKLHAFEESKPQYVKKVLFSGSVMPCKYLRTWQEALPEAVFVNQYGPTECTASCTYYVVPKIVSENENLPIGRPYPNYSILLLDENNTETPPGEIGEICVKGTGLTLGYYGDKKRTEESYIQNPLNQDFRELIYKTGDLGRWNENGDLEFHGRKDRQIKHMGHRIELGEIESTAEQIAGIAQSCALYQQERELLYLFYTGTVEPKMITLYFRENLPGFMTPRKIVKLEQLPTLPNGKTDYQSLKKYFK